MREILFRGQTRRYGEKVWMNGNKVPSNWVYGGICQGKGSLSIIYGSMDDKLEAPPEKHVVYTNTVGQYTGLTDKNGKKIFEGDILRPFDDEIIVVEWIDHYSTLGLKVYVSRKEKKRGKEIINEYSGWAYLNDYDLSKLEVIGNIPDRIETLKGGE